VAYIRPTATLAHSDLIGKLDLLRVGWPIFERFRGLQILDLELQDRLDAP